ncbi:MAG TPA: hypothetical protein VGI93_06095 [Steroidobacteraceae bacterium]|jgi:hypothetical protein
MISELHTTHRPPADQHGGRLWERFFRLFGGPLAWFLQLNAGFALASQPCFHAGERRAFLAGGTDWSFIAMVVLMGIAVAIALLAALVAWSAYRRGLDESEAAQAHATKAEARYTRFLAFWGVCLGLGFALATVLTAVAFVVLPRCAG